ncbi:hypothetical protein CERSUDRAFT_118491 [Gelatoporia subvermispora B]|uniref:Cytochrome P450 n=1 Tax=Ceriporiopsis subvermispora (strain B) TaxID=914234 RepID=M2Q7F4_CERS8|nr:hypothetical protein CERSUDRAFT_118491 [Gelatoporia subvermispora B]
MNGAGIFDPPPSNYRARFLWRTLSAVWRPICATFLFLKVVGPNAWLPHVVAYGICVPLCMILMDKYKEWYNRKLERMNDAEPVPRVRGKWPGNIDVMLRLGKDMRGSYALQVFSDLLDEYQCNTLNIGVLWKDVIITRDDFLMKAVHSTRFPMFRRSAEGEELMASFLGRGVFVTNGEEWKHNRAMIRPFFHKERVSDLHVVDRYAAQTLAILSRTAQSEEIIDIQDLFCRFTLDSGADFIAGIKPKSLSAQRPVPFKAHLGAKGAATDDEFGTFAHAFDNIQVQISLRSRFGTLWPLHELIHDRTSRDAEVIKRWITPKVEEALREKAKGRTLGLGMDGEQRSLLDTLMEDTDDEASIRFGLLNVLMAARDTTAALLSFTTYLLAMHPNVMIRLRQEVLDNFGPSGRPSREALQRMSYLSAVLNESLRLFPPAAAGAREAVTDGFIKSGDHGRKMHIPKGARVRWITLALHRRKDLWGEDSDEFKPERWLDPALMTRLSERPTMFIPFLQGPRTCPGQEFAKLEVSYLLTRIAQKFSVLELVPEALPKGAAPPEDWKHRKGRQAVEKCWPLSSFTMYIKGGLWVRVRE